MKIKNILDELRFADENSQIICVVPSAELRSRIYIVGQVLENTPGVVLGERGPHLREKTVGNVREELKTFGARFEESDFLIESTHEINEEKYEVRYYKLTHIRQESGEVVLHSEIGELQELREVHQEPECE
ncbi:hypothetical protein [Pseudoalteromonas luteoviolacea]|uniref:Uncharacterized protein n=1 Tax=Pseudoalteromonas luteoviolacea S4060-1 TaxID=1365257 RepID=A0A162CLD0_9GAMM|nr:hypothetical protein [Pseudoalteromonas luteoviolacea]KZN70393.1 hypothetical protein N478_00385 [Pseudoalteromonas luteoviolacea S4060-1]